MNIMEIGTCRKGEIYLMTLTFERSVVGNIRVHVLPTDRFKTFSLSVYIGQPLNEQDVTRVALTPFVLRRGTQKLPDTQQFREKLDELYGAGFGFDIYKRGNNQLVQFRLDMINDRFVSTNESLLKQAIKFMGEAITKPALEAGHFRDKYVSAEKVTLQKKIEAIINDKIRYAAERCMEEMNQGDPFRLHPLGRIDDLESITPVNLYEGYRKWLSTSPIDLYVVGQTTLGEVEQLVKEAFQLNREECYSYQVGQLQPVNRDPKTIIEKLDVNQGKLNLGLRSSVTYADDAYAAALMYNGILGGYPHSKLFMNVREKASLAYYASSRLDGHKGIIAIQSGIEVEDYERAVDIIRNQLEAMKQGEISESEIEQTRAMLSNHLREIQDSAYELISLDFNTVLSGKERSVHSLLQEVNAVDLAAIQEVAKQVQLDTIYFLRDKGGN